MSLTPVKTPAIVKKMFPGFVWEIPSYSNDIYLTFDDGPTPKITSWVLDVLNDYDAKATFFCIGQNAKKHPKLFKRIKKEEHSIGNHTFNHIKGWQTSTQEYVDNVLMAQQVINNQLSEIKLFRPPYGQITTKQGKSLIKLGYKIIMWHLLSFDWDKTISQDKCLNNIITKAKPGSIVVFHDSEKASKNMQYALPKVLEHFSGKGYQFKSIDP